MTPMTEARLAEIDAELASPILGSSESPIVQMWRMAGELLAEVRRLQGEVDGLRAAARAPRTNRHSHYCPKCKLDYTPAPMACEDCPQCGDDGTGDREEEDEHWY